MYSSKDPKELEYVWKEWRKAVGPKMRKYYEKFVRLNNVAARENGWTDAGAYKRESKYEVRVVKLILRNVFLTTYFPVKFFLNFLLD